MPVANKHRNRAAKVPAPIVDNPDFKVLNFNALAKKMSKKHKNLYPRLRLFVRGFDESVSSDIVRELQTLLDVEVAKIKAALELSLEKLQASGK